LHVKAAIEKNDKKAGWLIGIFTVVVLVIVSALGKIKIDSPLGFDVNVFALANAVINSVVAVLLVFALIATLRGKYTLHRNLMFTCLGLSILFLVSYITHKLFSGEAIYGDIDHDGVLSEMERAAVSSTRGLYLVLLITHITLAGVILPFILYTAYRALTGEWYRHKKIARITWPLWFYVAVTGPVVYWMIKPYYV
jgi:putative membrane protein